MLLIFWVPNWIMLAGKKKNENPPLSRDRRRKNKRRKGRTGFLGGVGGSQGQELKTEEVASHQPLLLVQPLDGSYLTIQGHSAA